MIEWIKKLITWITKPHPVPYSLEWIRQRSEPNEESINTSGNYLCNLGNHNWQTYDPPHWRYCKGCGLEQSYDLGFDSKEWEDIRINQKLIGQSINTSEKRIKED